MSRGAAGGTRRRESYWAVWGELLSPMVLLEDAGGTGRMQADRMLADPKVRSVGLQQDPDAHRLWGGGRQWGSLLGGA